jgi:hypothetical protein
MQGPIEAGAMAENRLRALVAFLARRMDDETEHLAVARRDIAKAAKGFVSHGRDGLSFARTLASAAKGRREMWIVRATIAGGLFATLVALAPVAALAASVLQENFHFVDHNFGAGDRPFGLAMSRDGNQEIVVLASVDDKGSAVALGFLTSSEWQRFAKLWQEAKASIIGPDHSIKGWDYTDVEQTKLTVTTTIYGSLLFDIAQPGSAVCMFFVDKDTEPAFDAAVAKISARFKVGR